MIIVCQKPLKKLKINGIALFPFIFIRKPEDKENNILINHEKIHLRQQLEMLIIFSIFSMLSNIITGFSN
jgi:hypothetical protein